MGESKRRKNKEGEYFTIKGTKYKLNQRKTVTGKYLKIAGIAEKNLKKYGLRKKKNEEKSTD